MAQNNTGGARISLFLNSTTDTGYLGVNNSNCNETEDEYIRISTLHRKQLGAPATNLGWKRHSDPLLWHLFHTHTHHVLGVNVEGVEEVRVGSRLAPLVDDCW